jgi:hypothetical protein
VGLWVAPFFSYRLRHPSGLRKSEADSGQPLDGALRHGLIDPRRDLPVLKFSAYYSRAGANLHGHGRAKRELRRFYQLLALRLAPCDGNRFDPAGEGSEVLL